MNGRFGDDKFNVLPVGLVGVTTINVNGGDSTDADSVVVSGSAATETVTITPTGPAGATVSGLGANVVIATTEKFLYNGLGGNDVVIVVGTAANDAITHTPGATNDSGSVGVGSALGIAYNNLGATGSVTANGNGGTDTLVVSGTNNSDVVGVSTTGVVSVNARIALNQVAITNLRLNTGDGDDSITIAGGQPYANILVDAGNPSASDTVSLSGATGAVVIDLGALTVTGFGGVVSLIGVEMLNVDAEANSISVVGTATADSLNVIPTGANTATMTAAGLNMTVKTNNTSSLTVDGAAGTDTVTINGTSANDVIGVARTATAQVSVGALKVVQVSNSESLRVLGGDGNDTINVTGTGSTAFLVVDGGLNSANDSVSVTNSTAGTTTFTPGTLFDAYTLGTPDGAIDILGTELVTLNGAAAGDTLTANGTHGNDTIALQFLGGANRIWLNASPVVSFTSFGTVNMNGRFGDDKFNVLPVGLVGVTTINVNGGDPTASDELVVTGSDLYT